MEEKPQQAAGVQYPAIAVMLSEAKHLDSVPPKAGKRLPNGHIEILRFAQNDGVPHFSF